jgi:hypothetical protein
MAKSGISLGGRELLECELEALSEEQMHAALSETFREVSREEAERNRRNLAYAQGAVDGFVGLLSGSWEPHLPD